MVFFGMLTFGPGGKLERVRVKIQAIDLLFSGNKGVVAWWALLHGPAQALCTLHI